MSDVEPLKTTSDLVKRLLSNLPEDWEPRITKDWFGYSANVHKGMMCMSMPKWRPTLGMAQRAGRRWAKRKRRADARRQITFPTSKELV